MILEFKSSFERDLRRIQDADIRSRVRKVIELAEKAENPQEIEQMGKLRGGQNCYRIKVGDYRIGLILDQGTLVFVRFLHRKDIYRYFP